MKRYLCVYLPAWPPSLQKLLDEPHSAHRDDCYVGKKQQEVLFSLKRSRSPQVEAPSPQERAFIYLCKLVPWALKYAPLVSIDRELVDAYRCHSLTHVAETHYGLILDTTGTEKLHGGETALLEKMHKSLLRRGIENRCAIAPSVAAAWAISRFCTVSRTQTYCCRSVNEIVTYLSPLPLTALQLKQEAIETLSKLGIAHIGQLLELPSKTITQRLGIHTLERIQQALAQKTELLLQAKVKEVFRAEKRFEVSIASHVILQEVVVELFCAVIKSLQQKKKIAGAFFVELYPYLRRQHATPLIKTFSLYEASNNQRHILSVIQPWIETVSAKEGIQKVVVEAKFTKPLYAEQIAFEEEEKETKDRVPDVLNQLVVRLGKNHIAQIHFEESHIPEKSFAYHSVMDKPPPYRKPSTTDRPSHLLATPEVITALALLPDHPPAWVQWRGEKLQIVKGLGPERISPEWWSSNGSFEAVEGNRDYFKLQDQHGRWLWVYRSERDMRWFVHGLWS